MPKIHKCFKVNYYYAIMDRYGNVDIYASSKRMAEKKFMEMKTANGDWGYRVTSVKDLNIEQVVMDF